MKFCKNLQRVVDISDPEWAPYWTNYKMLKKLIKELPSLVPTEGGKAKRPRPESPAASIDSSITSASSMAAALRQADKTTDNAQKADRQQHHETLLSFSASLKRSTFSGSQHGQEQHQQQQQQTHQQQQSQAQPQHQQSHPASASITTAITSAAVAVATTRQPQAVTTSRRTIGKSPGEIAFFKLLHAEFKKASHFFDRAQQEFIIREERVRKGMEIMKQPNSIMVDEKWSLLAKSIYRLYKDLLLLETFAIMTYCSFSKILKKHDKVTGYDTRNAFMANVVNKANFTSYPRVMEMITRCERLYEEVSKHLLREGKEGLYEDERLFINMIHRLNEQVLDTAESEGAERKESSTNRRKATELTNLPKNGQESDSSRALRGLVEEIEQKNLAAQVSEGQAGMDGDDDSDDEHHHATKRPTPAKRQKLDVSTK
mmetsp:Transcript_2434/g.6772  ORF Transcript_2434/g.6772 Transcript_2434/m.6772 type:complete len:430 (-) Transcript_2434:145-1434(-)|eukprot:CAMPEP_0198117572 /NCGR_PEP_ID=MMETSP1442-20131203/18595_1 /TAXON_ID= /ORGANISM="Craspedostauros australis, Strain CCMP3328" /LENGTH=429 /DNA_ID=CAMNT_0043775649 /DNA_START=230 /DNA_END=1519 /DNA_ORIENTATION=+